MLLASRLSSCLGCAVFLLCAALSAQAGDAGKGQWQFSMTPYIWATSLDGDVTVRGQKSEVDVPFLDIIEEADSIFAYMSQFEAHNDTFGFFVAPLIFDLTVKDAVNNNFLNVDIEQTLVMVDVGGFYRVAKWDAAGKSNGGSGSARLPMVVDLLAGARYTNIDVGIDLESPPPLGLPDNVDASVDWIDPFIGLRVGADLSE